MCECLIVYVYCVCVRAGICCGADGDGSYQALLDGAVVASGGQYGLSESTQFVLSPICRTFDLNIVVDQYPGEISWQVPT